MTSAETLRAAAAKLRAPLPAPIAMVPRIVQGDGETQSALAWCEDHTNWTSHGHTRAPDDAETSACYSCDVAELNYPALAELIRDLLAGREQFAAQLDEAADRWNAEIIRDAPEGPCCAEPAYCGGHGEVDNHDDGCGLDYVDDIADTPRCTCFDAALASARAVFGEVTE